MKCETTMKMRLLLSIVLMSTSLVWAQQSAAQDAGSVQGAAFNSGGHSAITCRDSLWIDPDTTTTSGAQYVLYPQPSRAGRGEASPQGSMLIYLPPDYQKSNSRYPVVYFMHGGAQTQTAAIPVLERLDKAIRDGRSPPIIMVAPEALTDVRYINTKDGTRPLEDIIVKDLISYVDSHYRTIATREARGIEGFSMGGFGALRLGFKFTNLFGSVSALAPSITDMKDEPPCVIEPFGADQAFYDEVGPWSIVRQNAESVRAHTRIRLMVGDKDKLQPLVNQYSELLTSLGIRHVFAVSAPNVDHRVTLILDSAPYDPFFFWKESFAAIKY